MESKLDLKEIKIEDKGIFDKYFEEYRPLISELTFTNLFCWRLSKKHTFSVFNGHLLVSFIGDNKQKFYQPVGKNPAGVIKEILEIFPDARFERVEKSIVEKLSEAFIVAPDRNMYDYIYKIPDLTELPGTKYQPKRNFVKRFGKYNPVTCILNEKTAKGFCELQEEWCNLRNCHEDEIANSENVAVHEALINFKALKIFGFCVYIQNKIVAFAIGEPLNNDTFVEHFEKANTELTGVYQYLLNEFAKHIPKKFAFLNREQDLGVDGLRKSKLSYYPTKFIEKYSISKK